MSEISNLLKRIYEVNQDNPLTSASIQKSNVIASMLYKVQGVSPPVNYNNFVERMLIILRQMSNLQLTVFSESLTPPSIGQRVAPIPTPPQLDIPRPDPLRVTRSRGYTPIESIIRRILRTFRFRPTLPVQREPPTGILPTQEPEPVPEIIEPTTEAIPELVSEKIPREPTQISWPQYSRKVSQSIPYVQASYKQKVKPDPILAKPGAPEAREIEMEFLEDSEIPISVIPDEPKLPSPILTGEPAIPELPPIPPSPLGDIKQRVASVGILGLGFAEKAAFFLRRDSPPLHRLIERVSELAKVPVLTSEVPPDATQIGTRLLRAPSVLKAIQLSAQQVFQQTLRVRQSLVETAEGAPRVLSELESTQVVERILDDTDAVAEVVERERESRAAMVTAQVDKVTRELSERVSETYQRGMSSLLPGFMGSAAGHLALAPSMGKMSTMEMTQMSERMASLYSSQEFFEEQAKYVSGSAPFQQFLTISQQVTNMAGAARGLEFLGDTIGELASSIPYYGQPPSRQMMQVSHQMEELAAAAQANKVASMFTELVETQIRTEQLFGEPIEGAISSIMEAPVGADALDRIILDTPVGYPSLKLHEVLPVVQRIAQAPTRIPEQTPRPRPTFVTEKPAEFREAQRFDDIDMKELEKKIARILKEEARRYGVY